MIANLTGTAVVQSDDGKVFQFRTGPEVSEEYLEFVIAFGAAPVAVAHGQPRPLEARSKYCRFVRGSNATGSSSSCDFSTPSMRTFPVALKFTW
jgi:hypothetical protein